MAFLNNILDVVVVAFVFVVVVAAAAAVVVFVDFQQHEGFRNLAGNMLMEMSYLSLTS